jgi:3-methylfumaryl-CoA hydratase
MADQHLQDWIGRSETHEEMIAPFPANALAATLDRDDPEYTDGSALPPLWHWLHFLPICKLSDTGYDGHPALGGFLPPVQLPRRMWAGSRLRFAAPLRIGRHLRKRSEVVAVQSKQGRSGALVFVTVRHQLFDGDTLGVDEEHDIVYREAPAPGTEQPKLIQAPATSEFSREICASPVLLFRYSALTFNGHRIHYDQPFCTTTEGYDGLVVHGPLLATLLLDLLRRQLPQAQVTAFHFRALATICDGETFTLHGTRGVQDGTFQLWAQRPDGALAMQAEAQIQ